MSFLFNNVTAIVVALVSSALVWVFGGTRGDLLPAFVPWLFAIMLEVIFFFPQRHYGETTYEARARVWAALKRDPVVWVSAGLLILLLIPFVNNGLCPVCDAAKIAQGIDPEPPATFLPFCVNRHDHMNVVLWFALALPCLVAVRDCLTRSGKRLVIELIVWNGAAVAALGFLQEALSAPGPLWCTLPDGSASQGFFSTFGYPNMAGDYFVTLFGLAVALWRDRYEQDRLLRQAKDVSALAENGRGAFWRRHYFLIPATVFFFAALNTLSRAAIILSTATACLYFLHTLISFLHRMRRVRRVYVGVWSLAVFGLLVFCANVYMPKSLQKEVDSLGTLEVLDRVTGRGQYHSRVATEIWKNHKLFGCGGWGYVHFCIPTMTPEERKGLQRVGGSNVHNDHLQFLAEHGLVGFGAMVSLVFLLVAPVGRGWRRLVRDLRFKKGKDLPAKPIQIFALPAPVFFILLTALSTTIHAFGDCPLRSPAVLTLFYVSLAAMPGFMPKFEDQTR